ncbi:MAG: hypothetical protein M3457_15295 [Chloroflexota bacterium]|nr:hypothetical protein [Chloroflexota bacterium]
MSMADDRDRVEFGAASHGVAGRLTRRKLLAGSGAAVAGTVLAPSGLAQEATPATVDPAAFRALCVAVTGSEELDESGLAQLQGLFLADEEMATRLSEVLAMGSGPLDMRELPFPALVIVTNILQFWFLGHFKNDPIENRAERLGNLVSYKILPYVTIPAVCKEFGYWAIDPGIADRDG